MSIQAPVGLLRFPVTKLCLLTDSVLPILASVSGYKYIFLAQYDPFISTYHQYYRLALFQLCPLNESDVILLFLIWYHFRSLERLMGSRKYLSVLSLAYLYTTGILVTLNLLVNAVSPWSLWNRYPSGALPLVLAMFHLYKRYTPQIYEWELVLARPSFGKDRSKEFRLSLNDHFYINGLVALLVLNQGLVGLGCGFLGWLCGVCMEIGLLPGMGRWRLPFVAKLMHLEDTRAGGVYGRSNGHGSSGNNGSNYSGVYEGATSAMGSTTSGLRRREGNPGGLTTEPDMTDLQDDFQQQDDENPGDEPERSLGVQFLDTFRR